MSWSLMPTSDGKQLGGSGGKQQRIKSKGVISCEIWATVKQNAYVHGITTHTQKRGKNCKNLPLQVLQIYKLWVILWFTQSVHFPASLMQHSGFIEFLLYISTGEKYEQDPLSWVDRISETYKSYKRSINIYCKFSPNRDEASKLKEFQQTLNIYMCTPDIFLQNHNVATWIFIAFIALNVMLCFFNVVCRTVRVCDLKTVSYLDKKDVTFTVTLTLLIRFIHSLYLSFNCKLIHIGT